MKKSLLFTLILCTCLFTGCTKNYKTVDEYSTAMKEVRNQLGDYTIEAKIMTDDGDVDCISYKKGDKWKTETSKNNGRVFNDGILYDGKEVYSYSKKHKMAMSIPFKQMLQKSGVNDNESLDMVMKIVNPTGILFYWDLDEIKGQDGSSWTFGKNIKKNNFPCRMLQHADGAEVCVSDKYGIAVYAKISTPQKGNTEFNVKTIKNTPILDSDLGLPKGVKKMSMSELFRSMAKMMD